MPSARGAGHRPGASNTTRAGGCRAGRGGHGLGAMRRAGGGSGGGIYLDVGIMDVQDGTITANGGNGAGSGASGGGGGGGGMVAIRYHTTTGTFTQTRQARGGSRGTTALQAQPGGPGTF